MCSIFTTNKKISDELLHDHLLERRGPDQTNIVKKDNFIFVHYLLSMTGKHTIQPIIDDNIVCLFNGEIYNYLENKHYESDVFKIIEEYKNSEEKFIKNLDGEFAIVLFDFVKNVCYFSTDIFGIKPLFISVENQEFGISSYREPLIKTGFSDIFRCEPNSLYKLDLLNYSFHKVSEVYSFDLNQYKDHFNDWNKAFLKSIEKRFKNTKYDIILPLSSGHDSGAIACAFDLLDIDYTSFSFIGDENIYILNSRINKKKEKIPFSNQTFIKHNLSDLERIEVKTIISNNCAFFSYGGDLDYKKHEHFGINDKGAHGLTYLLNFVKSINPNIRILASGQGGDEITTNLQTYKFKNPNPEIFPENLSDVFPWDNFFYGSQSSYLSKEESISGGFGIEGRYPFLDKQVVQEYLWLTSHLKNKYYKSPITNFMIENNYPVSIGNPKNFKRGFNV